MNILFTICARAGSKGVKNKNIRDFNGYPLVYYTLSAYKIFLENSSSQFDKILLAVNTDSLELIEQIKKTKIDFIQINRKQELAGDYVSKLEVIKDTVREVESLELDNLKFDTIVDLDLTSPLRQDKDIGGVIDSLLKNSWADLAFSVTHSRRLPFFNMVKKNDDGSFKLIVESNYVSRQQAPMCYDMNASIYAYRREFIINKDNTKVFDGKAIVYEMIDTAVLDIDNEEDFELMEVMAKHFYHKNVLMKNIESTIKTLINKSNKGVK